MLTPILKSKVAALWDKFWSGGISNPLNAIEQITYLLFMKQLDETDKRKMSNADFLGEEFKSFFSGKYFPPGVDEKDEKNNIYWLGEVLVIKLGLYFFLEKSKCQKEDQISNRLLSVDL